MTLSFPKTNFYVNYTGLNFLGTKGPQRKGDEEKPENEFSTAAFEKMKSMLKLPVEEMSLEKVKATLDVPIRPICELADRTTETACFDYNLDILNGTLEDLTIYVAPLTRKDKPSKTVYAMDLGHEYTHFLQAQKSKNSHIILLEEIEKAGFDPKETMEDILHASHIAFKTLGGETQRRAISGVLGKEGEKSYKRNHGLILTGREVSENGIARAIGFKDEENFIKTLKRDVRTLGFIAQNLCVENPALRTQYNKDPKGTATKVYNIICNYCANSAAQEKEAYYTENKIAALQCYEDKGSELCYKYYQMLEKAMKY